MTISPQINSQTNPFRFEHQPVRVQGPIHGGDLTRDKEGIFAGLRRTPEPSQLPPTGLPVLGPFVLTPRCERINHGRPLRLSRFHYSECENDIHAQGLGSHCAESGSHTDTDTHTHTLYFIFTRDK